MPLAFGIITVMAGAGYILWQVHKESKGFLSCMLVIMALVCAPLLITQLVGKIDAGAGAIIGVLLFFAFVGFIIYIISTDDQRQKKLIQESMQIWDEVYKLPLPDEETIQAYKLANKIPLYPKDCKTYTDAAIQIWRTHEYNERFKEKHTFYFYVK